MNVTTKFQIIKKYLYLNYFILIIYIRHSFIKCRNIILLKLIKYSIDIDKLNLRNVC